MFVHPTGYLLSASTRVKLRLVFGLLALLAMVLIKPYQWLFPWIFIAPLFLLVLIFCKIKVKMSFEQNSFRKYWLLGRVTIPAQGWQKMPPLKMVVILNEFTREAKTINSGGSPYYGGKLNTVVMLNSIDGHFTLKVAEGKDRNLFPIAQSLARYWSLDLLDGRNKKDVVLLKHGTF